MRGISTSHSHPRPCSGRKTLRRCRNNDEADNVILIDVDSEHFDNVIIIDVPESLPKSGQGSSMLRKDKKQQLRTVICIDDDESPDNCYTSIGVKKCTFAAGASSSRSSIPLTKNFEDASVQERQFIQENLTPVRLSKCKRTYSGKASTRNSYGLTADSESDSAANDYPDCELREDVFGKVQEQWEKAFSRRGKGINNGQSGMRDRDGTSRIINGNYQQNVKRKGKKGQHKDVPSCSHTGKFSNDDEGPSPRSTSEDAHYGRTYVSRGRSDIQGNDSPSIHAGQEDRQHFEPGSSSRCNGNRWKHPASSYSSHREQSTKGVDCPTPAFEDVEESPILEPYRPKSKSSVDGNSCYGRASSVEDDVTINKCQDSFEAEIDPVKSLRGKFKKFQVTAAGGVEKKEHLEPCEPHAAGSVKKTHNLVSERSSFVRSTLPDRQMNNSFIPSCDAVGSVSGESFCLKNPSLGSGNGIDKGCHWENRQIDTEITLFGNIHLNEAKLRQGDFVSNSGLEGDKDDQLHTENGDTMNSVGSYIISVREKIKETDEYKRAIEEEWASRQQALQIQAAEAQRLRRLQKRRKAESMRLLDMERRQKQRVEEMRSTQKKDEENMNLKEVVRAEVRKELKILEMTCINMASLLHSFGICVGGWPNPSPQEVQTAYKRALLTFHPDRASRSDIRQQVEAEEKFKLMNRMKEKFSLSL